MNKVIVVTKSIVEFDGRYLIVKRCDEDEIGAGTWEFPGGKLEFNESMEDCILREIKEETGLDAEIVKLGYVTDFFTAHDRKVVLINYICRAKSANVTISAEHSDFKWVNKDNILKEISPNIADSLIQYKVLEAL